MVALIIVVQRVDVVFYGATRCHFVTFIITFSHVFAINAVKTTLITSLFHARTYATIFVSLEIQT